MFFLVVAGLQTGAFVSNGLHFQLRSTTPSGKSVYTANVNANTVSFYHVDSTSGALSLNRASCDRTKSRLCYSRFFGEAPVCGNPSPLTRLIRTPAYQLSCKVRLSLPNRFRIPWSCALLVISRMPSIKLQTIKRLRPLGGMFPKCEERTAAFYGFAVGEKNPIGKSFAVRRPAGASRITGMELTATEAVAMSP